MNTVSLGRQSTHQAANLKHWRRQSGLSIIELMVAITLGAFILIGLIGFATSASRDQSEIVSTEQQLDNGRFALEILEDDVKHAGFFGFYHDEMTTPGTAPAPCLTDLSDAAFRQAVQVPLQIIPGEDDVPAAVSACVADEDYLEGTDIIVVRRADTGSLIAPGSQVANVAYIQGNLIDYIVGDASAGWLAGIPIRRYRVHIYYLDCSVDGSVDCTGKGRTVPASDADFNEFVPTLKRLTLREDGTEGWNPPEVLAEGINNLQIDVGIDTDGDGIANDIDENLLNGTQAYSNTPTLGQLRDIVTARIFVLARTARPSMGYASQVQKRYNLGLNGADDPNGDGSPYGDGFKRRVLSSTVHLINIGERRSTLAEAS